MAAGWVKSNEVFKNIVPFCNIDPYLFKNHLHVFCYKRTYKIQLTLIISTGVVNQLPQMVTIYTLLKEVNMDISDNLFNSVFQSQHCEFFSCTPPHSCSKVLSILILRNITAFITVREYLVTFHLPYITERIKITFNTNEICEIIIY